MEKSLHNNDFLISSPLVKQIYSDYAKHLPIVDYHCHIRTDEVYNNNIFNNITDIWLTHDHYKWRLMRMNGIDERYITGNASDREKFDAWLSTIEKCFGNPLYTWCQMELSYFFDIHDTLCRKNADIIWEKSCEAIQAKQLSPRKCLEMCNVSLIATTDSPFSRLLDHQRIKHDSTLSFSVVPTFRIDTLFNMTQPNFFSEIEKEFNLSIPNLTDFLELVTQQIDHFHQLGCRSCDLGLATFEFNKITTHYENTYSQLYHSTETSSIERQDLYHFILQHVLNHMKQYNWVLQLHIGAVGNVNQKGFIHTGSDKGFAAVTTDSHLIENLSQWFNDLQNHELLPKTIVYTVDPALNYPIQVLLNCFQWNQHGEVARLQHGPAWWFLDTYEGNKAQLIAVAEQGILGNFIGMTTDSRSVTSFIRHDYFRRILSELCANWIERGQLLEDPELLSTFFKNICYKNATTYFDFTTTEEDLK